MTRRDLLSIGAAALAAFGLSMAVLLPRTLNAGDDQQKLAAKVAVPKLTVNGCEFSIAGGEHLGAGQTPTFTLVAENKGEESQQVQLTVNMTHMQPSSPMSRSAPRPRSLWQTQRTITLGPGQRSEVSLESAAALPPAGNVMVTLSSGAQATTAMRFSPVPSKPNINGNVAGLQELLD